MQKFLQLSPWRPQDLKVIAGKVDYPSWAWYERLMIQLIMKYTNGPTTHRHRLHELGRRAPTANTCSRWPDGVPFG
jgi:menaquinone-dependent protoporphyrinogen IX oxidase